MKSLVFAFALLILSTLSVTPIYSIQVCPEGQHVDESTGACVDSEE